MENVLAGVANATPVKDISAALKEDGTLPKSASRQASIMVWVLSRMGLIEHVGFRNRAKVYKVTGE